MRSWESMQIIRAADGKLSFWASPNGAPRVQFPLLSQGPREVVFANPAHDYPQRIRYWREGERSRPRSRWPTARKRGRL